MVVNFGEPTPDQLRTARDEFRWLLERPTTEPVWQKFFSLNRFVLSRGLPLQLLPCDIIPLGRPGKSEPDFLIYPGSDRSNGSHGLVELKTHKSRVLRAPRRNLLSLTSDATTAVRQLETYNRSFDSVAPAPRVLTFASLSHLFIIMGRSDELDAFSAELRGDIQDLVTGGIRFVGFDQLLDNFSRDIPENLIVLEPHWPSPPTDYLDRLLSGPVHFEATVHRLQDSRIFVNPADVGAHLQGAMEFASRFRSRFCPPSAGVLYGAETFEGAYAEMTAHKPISLQPSSRFAHVKFRFRGSAGHVEYPGEAVDGPSANDRYALSSQIAQRAVERGYQAIRFDGRASGAKMIAVFDHRAISDAAVQGMLPY